MTEKRVFIKQDKVGLVRHVLSPLAQQEAMASVAIHETPTTRTYVKPVTYRPDKDKRLLSSPPPPPPPPPLIPIPVPVSMPTTPLVFYPVSEPAIPLPTAPDLVADRPPSPPPPTRDHGASHPQEPFALLPFVGFMGVLLFGALCVVFIHGMLYPSEQELVLMDAHWSFTAHVSEQRRVREEDWSLPAGALLLNTTQAVRTTREVLDRIDRVCHTKILSRSVFSHYEVQCRQEQVGETDEYELYSHSVEHCDDEGMCQEEDIFLKKRDPVYGQVCKQDRAVYKQESYPEEQCQNVRVTHQEPVYAPRYTYEIDRWVLGQHVEAVGRGSVTYPVLAGNQRLEQEQYRYWVRFDGDWPEVQVSSREQYDRCRQWVGNAIRVNVQWYPKRSIVLKD